MKIADDPSLLSLMMERQRAAGYAPSSHWAAYETQTLAGLASHGLSSFLQLPNSFGNFPSRAMARPGLAARALAKLRRSLSGADTYAVGRIVERSADDRVAALAGQLAEALSNMPNGERLLEVEDSLAGEPSDTVRLGERVYSLSFLGYFARAQWLLSRLEIPTGSTVVEIGPGYGGFFEVVRKLRPDLRFALIEISPQLYIAEQRAKAVFGDEAVVGFRATSQSDVIDLAGLAPGQVAIVAPWQFDCVRNVWLGVNQASMQEMTREQATRYLDGLTHSGMQRFFLINDRMGVIRPVEVSFTTDFAISHLSSLGFEVRACGPGTQYGRQTPFHDHLIFSR
jgi:putative sugar O-methyltransferase